MAANAASFSIEETSIAALHAAYLSGRATAVSVCQAHLDRIAAYDRKGPALGAIIINNPRALADAAALDAALASTGKLIGPLQLRICRTRGSVVGSPDSRTRLSSAGMNGAAAAGSRANSTAKTIRQAPARQFTQAGMGGGIRPPPD